MITLKAESNYIVGLEFADVDAIEKGAAKCNRFVDRNNYVNDRQYVASLLDLPESFVKGLDPEEDEEPECEHENVVFEPGNYHGPEFGWEWHDHYYCEDCEEVLDDYQPEEN